MYILGISGLYHDSAACLIKDGEIIAAAQEERFTRKKNDASFPFNAIEYCMKEGGITNDQIEYVSFYDNPILSMERYIANVLWAGEESKNIIINNNKLMFGQRLWIHNIIHRTIGKHVKVLVSNHHISHAASAFYPSPYEDAVIITIDGVGEWQTTTIGKGSDNKINIYEEINYPHSLGLFYSAFAYFCGFKVNSGEYKFMGLAPYGEPCYIDLIKDNVIRIKEDGSFCLNLEYFEFQYGKKMISKKLEDLFGIKRRESEGTIKKIHMDIASSVQTITEEIIIKIVSHAKTEYGKNVNNLVLAGGVALNCVANGKLLNEKIFDNIWIQPASGDAGGCIGTALYTYYDYLNNNRIVVKNDSQKNSYLGPSFSSKYIENFLQSNYIKYYHLDYEDLLNYISEKLCNDCIIGLFQGRMEFGPRALGNRSIIASAISPEMQKKLNLKTKYRESFRPFAPIVLKDDVIEYFEMKNESPYMLFTAQVKGSNSERRSTKEALEEAEYDMLKVVNEIRSGIPAVTHVDCSARIQTISVDRNPFLFDLLNRYKSKTGYSVLINTSFNVRGEPIVCTPYDAYINFLNMDMDVLILGEYIIEKEEQNSSVDYVWLKSFELD